MPNSEGIFEFKGVCGAILGCLCGYFSQGVRMILKDKGVFDINRIPSVIPVRNNLIEEIVNKIRLSEVYRLFISGVTGNGKTSSVKRALEILGNEIIPVYINCSETNSYTSISKHILEIVRDKPFSEKGKNRDELADELKRMLLTKRTKKLVFVFDEVDKLIEKKDNHVDIFSPLLNYGKVSFILISNDPNIFGKMQGMLRSRMQLEVKMLSAYQPGDILEILKQKAEEGMIEGSYDIETLATISKFSSDIWGDIRVAIKLLEKTAVITEMLGKDKISEEIIKEAIKELQMSEIDKVFPTLPRHLRWVVVALCLESRKNNGFGVTYPNAYETYGLLAQKERFGKVGDRQYRAYLDDLEMLRLFDFQWKPAVNRRGRVRIAIPKFDFESFLVGISAE